jgi:transmembrane sensor
MKKMPEKEELILVHRYLSGQMEDLEKQQFERRLAQEPELAALKNDTAMIWAASAQFQGPKFDLNIGYKAFQQNLRKRRVSRRLWITSAAAAVLLLLVAGGLYFQTHTNVAFNDLIASSTTERTLEDGSRIELRTGAHVRVPDSFGRSKRRVEVVSGDVYFDIAQDAQRPFIIAHPYAEVKVLGTQFMISVDTIAHNYLILVTEGKVSFTPDLYKEIILPAGTGMKFNADTRFIERIHTIDDNAISWHTGVLTFIDRPVGQVIADLETHYQIEIDLIDSRAEECLFTAPLPYRDVPVKAILDAVSTTFGMTLKVVNSKHYILTNGKCPLSK